MAPPGVEAVLRVLEQQMIVAAVKLLRMRQPVTPSAMALCRDLQPDGTPEFVQIPILDLQRRVPTLQHAARATPLAGYVLVFDGVVTQPPAEGATPTPYAALLVVTGTPEQTRAQAIPYRHTVEGLRVADPIQAPPGIANGYGAVFS